MLEAVLCLARTGLILRGDIQHGCLGRPPGQKPSCTEEAEGLPGVAMECNRKKKTPQKKLNSCRQAESLLDIFISRVIPGSTGIMIFKYHTRRKIFWKTLYTALIYSV